MNEFFIYGPDAAPGGSIGSGASLCPGTSWLTTRGPTGTIDTLYIRSMMIFFSNVWKSIIFVGYSLEIIHIWQVKKCIQIRPGRPLSLSSLSIEINAIWKMSYRYVLC